MSIQVEFTEEEIGAVALVTNWSADEYWSEADDGCSYRAEFECGNCKKQFCGSCGVFHHFEHRGGTA